MSKYNLTDLLPEGTDAEYKAAKEADRLKKHPEGDKIKAVQAMMAKEKSMKEDKYDDIVDADDDIPADKKKAAAMAYRKVDKGDSYEKATSHMKENYQMDGETYDRIDGLIDQPLLTTFKRAFELIYDDFIEQGEEFEVDDVVDFLTICLDKHSKETRMEDQLPDGFNEGAKYYEDDNRKDSPTEKETEKMRFKEAVGPKHADGTPKSNDEMTDDEREDYYNNLDSVDEGDAYDADEDTQDMIDKMRKDGKSSEDFVDEGLKEHFQRFLKDYQ